MVTYSPVQYTKKNQNTQHPEGAISLDFYIKKYKIKALYVNLG
jgi:hypothetical protein